MTDLRIDPRMDSGATLHAGGVPNDLLRSARFRLEREAHWRQLDGLVSAGGGGRCGSAHL